MIKLEIAHKSTKYAPAERESKENIQKKFKKFKNNEILNKILTKIPAIFLILNKYRQVVYMNEGALEFTGLEDFSSIIGKRPGEILGCIHHDEEEGGCGTSESCTYCGAVNVVLSSQKGKLSVQDCRITCMPNEKAFDLRIWAAPLEINGEEFSAVTIQDISDEKRRAIYERIFFHDIVNTLTGLTGTLQFLRDNPDKINVEEYLDKIDYFNRNIMEEVNFHRILTAAEKNSLKLNLTKFKTLDFINQLVRSYANQPIARHKQIIINPGSEDIEIDSDKTILRRILRNIINNALEASQENDMIIIGWKIKGKNIEFWINNPGVISREAELQIFQRSFSTKGRNRGLGTYSMKLLSSFLNGTVDFNTSEEKGTTFKAIYPLKQN
ncbi:MAG: sensor histidine kinase [Promethearchaeota archaeon]